MGCNQKRLMSEARDQCGGSSITSDDVDMKLQLQVQRQIRSIPNSRDLRNDLCHNNPFLKEDGDTIDVSANETDSENDDENQQEGVKNVMPAEFYQNFESFLSEGPPKLRRSKSAVLSSTRMTFSSSNAIKKSSGQMQKSEIKSMKGENSRWEIFSKIIVDTSNNANSTTLLLLLTWTFLNSFKSTSRKKNFRLRL